MNTYGQKLSLLTEMIEFAKVDGELHEREIEFLTMVARELRIEKDVFINLFRKNSDIKVIKSEAERIHQFYRLALLMHIDGNLHEKENVSIRQMGINMGLSPYATNRVLEMMLESSDSPLLEPEEIMAAFRQQQN
ncbi:MAG TPA: TerB family tellurite resistance protein [Flavobacterium sp.]|jgi:tellurite resistance protein